MGYVRVLTEFTDMSSNPFNGRLLAILTKKITLPGGESVLRQRYLFPVEDGIAYDADADGNKLEPEAYMELPRTDNATPADVPISFWLVDSNGRMEFWGSVVIPDGDPVELGDLTPQDPDGSVSIQMVRSIAGLDGVVLLDGYGYGVDAGDNTITIYGMRFRGAYSSLTAYAEGDLVRYESGTYRAIGATTGNLPTDTTYWDVIADPPGEGGGEGGTGEDPDAMHWLGTHNLGQTYAVNDVVNTDDGTYVCIQAHAPSVTPPNASYWTLLGQSSELTYGTAAPTTGLHDAGERVFNSEPTLTEPSFWECIVTGTPGTWRPAYLNVYDVSAYVPGVPIAGDRIFAVLFTRDIRFPSLLGLSQAYARFSATGAQTFSIKKVTAAGSSTTLGTINFGAGANVGTFTFASNADFTAGDRLCVDADGTDATLGDISFTLVGYVQ